jgi:hypothetical protein
MLRDQHTHSLVPPSADFSNGAAPAKRRGRKLRPLDLEGERVKAEREEFRRREVEAIARIDPACEVDGDPPVAWKVPAALGDEPTGVVLKLPRTSGRGLSGSHLVVAAREYDGTGVNGGEPCEYVSVFVTFRAAGAQPRRTQGVAIRPGELRAVARALLDMADRYGVSE